MEGIKFQLRTQRPVNGHYPLTLDQQIQGGHQFRLSEERLVSTLKSIEENFSTEKPGPPHTGDPACERCVQKKSQIWQAYYEYYLGNEPGRWDILHHAYREEMHRMMNSIPDRHTLEDVHARFEQELREHLKNDLCTAHPDDTPDLTKLKSVLMLEFDTKGLPTSKILEGYEDITLNPPSLDTGDTLTFMTDLQRCKTSRERIQIYQKYYCTPLYNDSPQQKNIKAKYARLFESGMSHDTVLGMWKKEALELQSLEITKLKQKMGELKMAQSAHLKNKAKKAEKDQRVQDREYVFVPKQTAICTLERCEREVNLAEGEVLECAVCDWLARKDRSERREHAYYCCEDHVEEDFEDHDRIEHTCIMSSYCIFDPDPGPEDTGQGGICPDCMDNGIISYFCSQDCYRSNLESHIEIVHYPKGIQGRTSYLEAFRPAADLVIVSS